MACRVWSALHHRSPRADPRAPVPAPGSPSPDLELPPSCWCQAPSCQENRVWCSGPALGACLGPDLSPTLGVLTLGASLNGCLSSGAMGTAVPTCSGARVWLVRDPLPAQHLPATTATSSITPWAWQCFRFNSASGLSQTPPPVTPRPSVHPLPEPCLWGH